MPAKSLSASYICLHCLRANGPLQNVGPGIRAARWQSSSRSPLKHDVSPATHRTNHDEPVSPDEDRILNSVHGSKDEKETGAMSRRLEAATEEALQEGGKAGRKAVEEAGFSAELKNRLLERIEQQRFRSENVAAFAEAGLSSAAGAGTRDIATAPAWDGTESREDGVLRMLNDAHKPLKPGLRAGPHVPVVDLRLKKATKRTRGQVLANARDRTSMYASAKDVTLSEEEREEMRRDLKERFGPGVRAMPSTLRGLQALANERIEDAIARGQFKGIPRGKSVVRDARADNPFIDTTEYIMNKMIQRQEIVPPWIEKQQELVKTARAFRARLRHDWARHAARTIAARGGSVQEQMRTAARYAEAEAVHNPPRRAVEQICVPTSHTDDPVMLTAPAPPCRTTEDQAVRVPSESRGVGEPPSIADPPGPREEDPPLPPPLRDPDWERAEQAYLALAIRNLNDLARTYNLMCPGLAKKPYYSVERELRMAYADVAPALAETVRARAARLATPRAAAVPPAAGGVWERFAGEERARVYDSRKPLYGFRDFWRDLWGRG